MVLINDCHWMMRLLDWASLCSWFSLVWFDGLGTMMVLMLLLSRTRRTVVHPTWDFIRVTPPRGDNIVDNIMSHHIFLKKQGRKREIPNESVLAVIISLITSCLITSSSRNREGNVRFPTSLYEVRRSARPTSKWAPKVHRMMGKTQ